MEKPRMRVRAELVNLTTKNEPEYHSASQGRRFAGYGTSGNGPNTTLAGSAPTLRNRSRHAYRNSPLIKKGLRSKVKDTIGAGIIPRFMSADKAFNEAMRTSFEIFSNECDPEGVTNFYGAQVVIDAARRLSGECFIRRRRRSMSSGLHIPLQIQVLESDFLPFTLNQTNPRNGNKIKHGIELNRLGQRVAYWMYKAHPGEADEMIDRSQLIRIPARDIIHCYWPERPGQLRGEPDATTALPKVKTYESYDDAELQRKESRSGYTGMLTRQEAEDSDHLFDPFTGKPLYDDVAAEDSLAIRPGTFITALPGEDLKLFDGDNTGSGYKDFTREQKLMIGAALNVPFELMTGDWAGVNDRIYRAFIQEYRRGIEMDQEHIIIYQALRVIKDWFIEAAVLAGVAKPKKYLINKYDYHKVEWRVHAWKHIHPVQDIQAQVMAKENRLNSGDALVAESGYEAEEIDKQLIQAEVRWNELRKEAGLPTHSPESKESQVPGEADDDEEDDKEEDDEPDNKSTVINFNGQQFDLSTFASGLSDYLEKTNHVNA